MKRDIKREKNKFSAHGEKSRTRVLGVRFDDMTPDGAARSLVSAAGGAGVFTVVTPNIEIALRALSDPKLSADIAAADLSLCDGIALFVLSKLTGRRLRARVPGIDLLNASLPLLSERGARLYLAGGAPGVAQEAGERIARAFPGIEIAGCSDGYADLPFAAKRISGSGACVALICLGSPLQESFAREFKEQYSDKYSDRAIVLLCLGGALDVLSGRKKRAPLPLRRLGLEWAWRFAHEPSRIIRFLKTARRASLFLTRAHKFITKY